jgi:predicted nucleic acid-binding protein
LVTYADSSFLVSLYADERNSALARAYVAGNAHPICLTSFSKAETEHALRLFAFRKLIALDEMTQCLLLFEEDQGSGIYHLLIMGNEELFQRASQLSKRHGLELGVRFLDVVHVAAAVLAKANLFLTFDARQGKLAKAVGLQVRP